MSSVPSYRSEPQVKSHKKKVHHAESRSRGATLYRTTPDGDHLRPKREGLKLLATDLSGLWHEALEVARELQAPKDASSTARSGSSRSNHEHRTYQGASIYNCIHYAAVSPAYVHTPVYHDSPPAYDSLYSAGLCSQRYGAQESSAYGTTLSVFKNAGIRKSQNASQESFVLDGTLSIPQQAGTRKIRHSTQESSKSTSKQTLAPHSNSVGPGWGYGVSATDRSHVTSRASQAPQAGTNVDVPFDNGISERSAEKSRRL